MQFDAKDYGFMIFFTKSTKLDEKLPKHEKNEHGQSILIVDFGPSMTLDKIF